MKLKYIDGFDDIKDLPFEEKVIKVLGKNHTNPIQFDDALRHDEPYGVYTYRGGVHIIKAGEEWSFEDLTKSEQKIINQRFDSGKWKINKALQ